MNEVAVLAAWMFDRIPWNPWVFWPLVVLPAIGLALLAIPPRVGASWLGARTVVAGWLLVAAALWVVVMAALNAEWETEAKRESRTAIREACFETMDDYAELVVARLEPDEVMPADMVRGFLTLPEGDLDVGLVREAMAVRGCSPDDLVGHIDEWEESWRERAEQRARERENLAKLDSAGGTEALLEAIQP